MRYLLDTNMCIYLIKRKPVSVVRRLQEVGVSEVGISSITLSELLYGVEKSERRTQNHLALAAFVTPLEIVVYDGSAAGEYGKIRSLLERQGEPIGALDLLIAAHALSLGCMLVTNNMREFKKVSGLLVEDWTVEG
ncbi:MAG: type II toxin-antitoxin system VapC family toxin [bacterium]|nr:type II toxin-antitoxin system VapC family toxin [bacterium]